MKYFLHYFSSVTFVRDNNCPRNKCTLPCRSGIALRIPPDPCFRRSVCSHFVHLLAILAVLVYACIRVLHAPQLPPRGGEGGVHRGGGGGSGTLPQIYLRAISPQVRGRFTVFLVGWSRSRRYSHSLSRNISARYSNAGACEDCETTRHAVTGVALLRRRKCVPSCDLRTSAFLKNESSV